MIISHRFGFIFIKTKKTAGTSIEIALSRFCGPDDVITPISPEDEALRQQLGYPGPQNYTAPIRKYSLRDIRRLALKGIRKPLYYNHIGAPEIRNHIDPELWDDYFKFSVERNPWDRTLSYYHGYLKDDPKLSLDDFLESSKVSDLHKGGFQLYTIDQKIAVDRILLYETLASELEEVRLKLRIPSPLDLPYAKSSARKDRRPYREVFDEQSKQRVERIFCNEIDLFGYEW